jgi:hypothetical protein
MTQLFKLIASNLIAPSFRPTLDGVQHNVVVTWNLARQGYYVNVYDVFGALVCATPLTTTATGLPLSDIEWDGTQGVVIATLAAPRWRPTGQIVEYLIEGVQPSGYNGTFGCLTLNPTQFQFPLAVDPGPWSVLGSASRPNDMIGPWFKTSTMIFRNGSFEVRP